MYSLGATSTGSQVMKKKTVLYNILLRNITTTEALIIKQELLARGGDASLPRTAVSHESEKADLILFGTHLQIERLINKMGHQVRNLPLISEMLSDLLAKKNDLNFRYSR
jgi:dihydropteroate synthase